MTNVVPFGNQVMALTIIPLEWP